MAAIKVYHQNLAKITHSTVQSEMKLLKLEAEAQLEILDKLLSSQVQPSCSTNIESEVQDQDHHLLHHHNRMMKNLPSMGNSLTRYECSSLPCLRLCLVILSPSFNHRIGSLMLMKHVIENGSPNVTFLSPK